MKYLITVFLISITIRTGFAQSVSVSVINDHAQISQNQIPLRSGLLTITSNQININGNTINRPLSWSVSPERRKVSILNTAGGVIFRMVNSMGVTLAETDLEFFDTTDETLKVYQFDDGRAVIRDNIANFSFFNSDGTLGFSVSNSSQSSGGEQISELAADPAGRTVVLYNPVISFNGTTGSRARIVYGDQENDLFYRSENRTIKQIQVTPGGSYITLLTSGGNNDRAHVYDRFGNEIYTRDLNGEQTGITLSGNGNFLTVYGSGRVQVFNILNDESIGSSSSRTPLLYAAYLPEDEIILALGGTLSGNSVSGASLIAVHIGKRQIARTEITNSPVVHNPEKLIIERISANRYLIKGMNQTFDVHTVF